MKLGFRHVSLILMLGTVTALGMGASECSNNTAGGPPADLYASRLQILSVRGNPSYVPTIEGAPLTKYYAPAIANVPLSEGFEPNEYHPENPEDPFFKNSFVAEVEGNIGEFGLTIENLDRKVTIESVFAVYIVEDLTKIAYPIPIRIADNLLMDWRDLSWTRHEQPTVFQLWDMYPYPFTNIANDNSGINYQAKFIDMAPGKRWDSYATFGAIPGLKVRVSAIGSLSDGRIVTTKPGHELTLYLKPGPQGSSFTSNNAAPTTLTAKQKSVLCADASTNVSNRIKCNALRGDYGCQNTISDSTEHSVPDLCKTD